MKSHLIRFILVIPTALMFLSAVALVGAPPAWASNDEYSRDQWGMDRIKGEQAWSKATGAGVVVAIVDTGINFNHEDLKGKSAGAWDCTVDPCRSAPDNSDVQGHGTAVGSIVAVASNNCKGMAAVAPDAKLMSVKVFPDARSTDFEKVNRGIIWAAEKGADVINLSLGSEFIFAAYNTADHLEALSYANSKGALIVAAAGNSGFASSWATTPYVYVVGSSGPSDEVAKHSDSFAGVDIHAPGGNPGGGGCSPADCITVADRGGGYGLSIGTSLAAPHVSGVGALLRSQGLSAAQAIERMNATADTIQGDKTRVNAAKAVGADPAAPTTSDDSGCPKKISAGAVKSSVKPPEARGDKKAGAKSASGTESPDGLPENKSNVTDEQKDTLAKGVAQKKANRNLYLWLGLAALLTLPLAAFSGHKLGRRRPT